MKVKIISIGFLVLFSLYSSALPQEARLVERAVNPNCEDYLARMDNYLVLANNLPNINIYLYLYEGKEAVWKNKEFTFGFPTYGSSDSRIRTMKRYLTLRKFPVERFRFVKGGFREKFQFEVWFVPPGVVAPSPTPTLTKMRYQKGKPKAFCMGCCEG
jgi:hypothetical protein